MSVICAPPQLRLYRTKEPIFIAQVGNGARMMCSLITCVNLLSKLSPYEYDQIIAEKKRLYAEQRKIHEEMQELHTVRANMEQMLQQNAARKEQERSHTYAR